MSLKKHIDDNSKTIAVKKYINGVLTQKQIAEFFEIDVRTVKRWIRRYKDDCLERKNRHSKSYKIEEKHIKYLLKLLKKYPRWSVKLYWQDMCENFDNFSISQGHLAKVIRDNNITRKRTRQRHYPETRYKKPINLKKELALFYSNVDKYSINKLISLDETSIHAQMVNSYSRCELGRRCVHKTKDNKVFVKFTLLCAISYDGIIGWTLFETGGVNSDRMIEFFKKFIIGKIKNNLIIMDNGGCHKSKLVKDIVKTSKNTLQYSVPYKPKTNAIESWFSQFKHYYKQDEISVNFNDVKRNVTKSIRKIKLENYRNYMKYAYKTQEIRQFTIKKSTKRKSLKNYKK